jgi:hypothetical protein
MIQSTDRPQEEGAICACTNPTHFLGRCQVAVNEPEKLCAQCMENHFTRNDDPTIVIE